MKHPVGTAVAALLLVASMALYVVSGGDSAAAHDNGGSGSSGPTTTVYQTLPACRVDVAANGIGTQRHHHVTVVLDNDLPVVWLQVQSTQGTRTIEVPVRNGWAQHALPGDEEPSKVVVFGSANLVGYTAGCAWSSGL